MDHIKVLDLQGQIYPEGLSVCVIPCECNYFWTILNLPFKLELCFIIHIIHVSDKFGTGALDLDYQDQIGLQTSTVFEKIEPFFTTPSNLKCELIIYWF